MAAKKHTILRNRSGAALVIALIMLVVITLIALAASYTSIFEIKLSGNKRGSTDAFYAADAGINEIMSYPTQSFNTAVYTVLVPNTSSTYTTPFSNLPTLTQYNSSTPISVTGSITYFSNQSGPVRGSGDTAVNMNYSYFRVQCIGNDSVGSGPTTTIEEDVQQKIPAQP